MHSNHLSKLKHTFNDHVYSLTVPLLPAVAEPRFETFRRTLVSASPRTTATSGSGATAGGAAGLPRAVGTWDEDAPPGVGATTDWMLCCTDATGSDPVPGAGS